MTIPMPGEQVSLHPTGPLIAPPVQAGIVPVRPTTWPMVIGVIAIVIGGIGILSNGCGGLLGPLIQSQMAGMFPQGSNPMLDIQVTIGKKYLWFQIGNALTLTALGILLIAAGVGIIRRRSWARRSALAWAWLRIVVCIPASYVGYMIAMETMQALANASNSGAAGAPPMPGGFMMLFQVFGAVGVVIGTAMVCACPVFTLIWFNRRTIRVEVAQWK